MSIRPSGGASTGGTGTYLMVVQAGSNADTARPDVPAGFVKWLCDFDVTPVNALVGDDVFNALPPPTPLNFAGSDGFGSDIYWLPVVVTGPFDYPDDDTQSWITLDTGMVTALDYSSSNSDYGASSSAVPSGAYTYVAYRPNGTTPAPVLPYQFTPA